MCLHKGKMKIDNEPLLNPENQVSHYNSQDDSGILTTAHANSPFTISNSSFVHLFSFLLGIFPHSQ